VPLKEAVGCRSCSLIPWCWWQLFVTPEDDYARPFSVTHHLVAFETDQRVFSHPLNFLAEGGVAIEKLAIEVHVDGHDVRLVVASARQPHDVGCREHGAALARRHLADYHRTVRRAMMVFVVHA
jgi:hypothetical protein